MKKYIFITLTIAVTAVILYACNKNSTNNLTEQDAVDKLVASENFVNFSTRFIPDFVDLMKYHRSVGDKDGFMNQVRAANDDEAKLGDAYRSVSLDYENAVLLKNKIDNDLLGLFNQNRFLLQFNEAQAGRIVFNALQAGITSNDPKWQDAKTEITGKMNMALLNNTLTARSGNAVGTMKVATSGLTLDEVWGCLRSAVGFGTAGVLGIGALQKLSQQGLQAVVINVSKWLAKRAGWIGLAIMVFDFAACLYRDATT